MLSIKIENRNEVTARLDDIGTLNVGRALDKYANIVNMRSAKRLSGPNWLKKPKKKDKSDGEINPAGAYPVPRRLGHLFRQQRRLLTNRTETHDGMTVRTGPLEVAVFNSAVYSGVIHEGLHTSKEHGPRRFILDSVKADEAADVVADEIDKGSKDF